MTAAMRHLYAALPTWSATVQTGAATFKGIAVEAETMREAIDRAAEFGVVMSCEPDEVTA